jgi:type VI secretion system protein ImpE
MSSKELLQEGRPVEALAALKEEIRQGADILKSRLFLFQLQAALGNWEQVLQQLKTVATLDAANLPLSYEYGALVQGEVFRAEVFAGNRTPVIFGEPPAWVGKLIQAVKLLSEGKSAAAIQAQEDALAEAVPQSGTIDGKPFEWLMDADSRFGPILEAYIEGKYYWVPLCHLAKIEFEKPRDLRDLIWITAKFTWTNGGVALGYVPARYPGSEKAEDGALVLSRTTQWRDLGPQYQTGLGLRVFSTEQDAFPITTTKEILLNAPAL